MLKIVLASSSKARKQCLTRLHIPFVSLPPEINETQKHGESASALVERLALEKAEVISKQVAEESIIVSGDQVITLENTVLGKPRTLEEARLQLQLQSGKSITSLASLCVLCRAKNFIKVTVNSSTAQFRTLSDECIERYLRTDKPLHCAGSVCLSQNGFMLLESLHSNDPYSVYGLPLLTLISWLNALGIHTNRMIQPQSAYYT